MSSEIPPWNPFQFILICTYTCFLSFFHTPAGGLAIIAVYVSTLVLAVPATFVQLKLGGYLQKGIVGAYSLFFPIWKGVGIAALIDLLLFVSTFAPLAAHLGTYAFITISNEKYIWGSSDSVKFITNDCVKFITNENEVNNELKVSSTPTIDKTHHIPELLFYKCEFLQLSQDVDIIDGFPQWRFTDLARKAEISMMPVTLAIVWVLVSLFVGFGPRICGWVLFLLGPAAVLCLLTVLGYGYHNLNKTHSLEYLRQLYMFKDTDDHVILTWLKGFKFVIYTFPMWTAICCTMGKLCGRSRIIRNLTWVLLLTVFLLVSQIPNLAMAPYLGNYHHKDGRSVAYSFELGRLMWQMPAAFTSLDIPPAYAFIFFLSAFLFTLMFLCIGVLTIVDNCMDSLKGWIDRHACSKIAVHLLVTFVVMLIAKGIGIIQTTKAGHYYFLLFTQSLDKLRFLMIILLAIGLIVVYMKQNFGLIERMVMGFWFTISAIVCSGLWLYNLYYQIKENSASIKYDALRSEGKDYFSSEWTWVSWAIAGFPYIGILLGTIHACFSACKDPSHKCRKLCCGVTERVREQNGEEFLPPPLLTSEPSAPPYMYSYMDRSLHDGRRDDYHLDHYKLDYDPPETEPLTLHNRSTRI